MTALSYRCLHTHRLPLVEPGMTNFDHSIDSGLAQVIADGQHMANYAGWDFHGYVYVVEGTYVCDVHRYGDHASFVSAESLEALMDAVSAQWGQA